MVEIRCSICHSLGAAADSLPCDILMGTPCTWPRPATDHSPGAHLNRLIWLASQHHSQTVANGRKMTPKKSYPFRRTFCKDCARIASLPISMGRGTIQGCSWPCNQLAILWKATTDCTTFSGWSVRMAERSTARAVRFRLF